MTGSGSGARAPGGGARVHPGAGPYRAAIGACVTTALVAAAATASIEVARAAVLSPALGLGAIAHLAAIAFALYAPLALALGLGAGAVAGAAVTSFGDRPVARARARLRADDDVDRAATGALVAGACAAAMLAAFVDLAAGALVVGVQRQEVGALLLGAVTAGSLPLWAALALPIYRLARRGAWLVPRLGPIPRVGVLAGAGAVLAVAAVAAVVAARLDWRALDLGVAVAAAVFATVALAWTIARRGPLARVRLPRRRAFVAVAAVAALVPILALAATPPAAVATALSERTWGAQALVRAGRAAVDGDGDGYSAFLGGPDCDDGAAAVHPGAAEVPGNGVDDNCLGGDRAPAPAGAPEPAAAADTGPSFDGNVLVIAVDTLRADRLGVAGYTRDGESLTPRMDRLAGGGAYFTHAYAQAPNTPRSFPSMLASKFPSQVAWDRQFKNYSKVLDANLLLFEVLRDAGLTTIGYSSHFYFTEERGIRQGFDEYDNEGARDIAGSNKDIASPRIVPKVEARLEELGRSGERFAMFVHLFEPHSTYMKHDEFPITERGIPGLVQKYDYEIAYVDRWVGRVLDAVAAAGLEDDTLVVLVSDHGEAFGVHRVGGRKMFFHGQTLYDELLRVPVLVRLPGREPVRVDDPVMLVDVAPTIVDALGLDVPESFVGRSLLPGIAGEPADGARAYGELLPAPSWDHAAKMMVTADGAQKLIYQISDRRFELYDLETDPEERANLARERPEARARLEEELARWIEVNLPRGETDTQTETETTP